MLYTITMLQQFGSLSPYDESHESRFVLWQLWQTIRLVGRECAPSGPGVKGGSTNKRKKGSTED